ncbi:MAG: hypothetical protein MPJ04_06385 [Nitrosopumilus sp.]|nr:hypothetical protein [Nitrosopumilus sp.]MDA7945284.1 hypothetical protein [Nitrosopumilus sp.]MDA7955222.1 hypothetical protein [Nitrosopumilus sp.]
MGRGRPPRWEAAVEEVEPSAMRDLPRVAVNPSEMMTKAAARMGTTMMPPVLLGRVDGVLYPVERPEPAGVLRASRIPRVRAFVIEYGSMTDLLTEHVHRCIMAGSVDVLRLQEVIKYMEGAGMDGDEARRRLRLASWPALLTMSRYDITDGARMIMLGLAGEVGRKLHTVAIPPYFVKWISRLVPEEQEGVARMLKTITMNLDRGEISWSWPSNDAVAVMIGGITRKSKRLPLERRVIGGDGSHMERARELVGSRHDLAYVPPTGSSPEMLVDMDGKNAYHIREEHGAYRLERVGRGEGGSAAA